MEPMLARTPRQPTTLDYSVAAAVAAVELGHAALIAASDAERTLDALGVLLLLAQTVPTAWRWRFPRSVALWCGLVAAVDGYSATPDPFPLGPLLAFGTLISMLRFGPAAVVGVLTLLGASASNAATGAAADSWFLALLLVSLTWLVGVHVQLREAYANEVRAHNERIRNDRRAELAQAAVEERSRIARELHDVVAHYVTSMVVQSEAAAARSGDGAFDAIAEAGRDALAELRRLLGALRDDTVAPRSPQPCIGDVDLLLGPLREAGLDVRVTIEGDLDLVPPGASLCAYRLVQESTTNVLRHAAAQRVDITVDVSPTHLRVVVSDDGRGENGAEGAEPGHGLAGMVERVRASTACFGPGSCHKADTGWTPRSPSAPHDHPRPRRRRPTRRSRRLPVDPRPRTRHRRHR